MALVNVGWKQVRRHAPSCLCFQSSTLRASHTAAITHTENKIEKVKEESAEQTGGRQGGGGMERSPGRGGLLFLGAERRKREE